MLDRHVHYKWTVRGNRGDIPPTHLSLSLPLMWKCEDQKKDGESIWIMTFPQAHRDKLNPDIWWKETEEIFQAAPRATLTLPHLQVTAHITGWTAISITSLQCAVIFIGKKLLWKTKRAQAGWLFQLIWKHYNQRIFTVSNDWTKCHTADFSSMEPVVSISMQIKPNSRHTNVGVRCWSAKAKANKRSMFLTLAGWTKWPYWGFKVGEGVTLWKSSVHCNCWVKAKTEDKKCNDWLFLHKIKKS